MSNILKSSWPQWRHFPKDLLFGTYSHEFIIPQKEAKTRHKEKFDLSKIGVFSTITENGAKFNSNFVEKITSIFYLFISVKNTLRQFSLILDPKIFQISLLAVFLPGKGTATSPLPLSPSTPPGVFSSRRRRRIAFWIVWQFCRPIFFCRA